MAEQVEQRRGNADTPPGQGEQLPYGAATQLNEATPPAGEPEGVVPTGEAQPTAEQATDRAPAAAGERPAPDSVEFADDGFDGVRSETSGLSEDEEILFADHPNGPQRVTRMQTRPNRVPSNVIRMLPQIARMARDPSAPASIKALYRAIIYELEREMNS